MVHFVAGALGFTFLAISCLIAARVMSRRNAPALARVSRFSGIAVLLGFFGGPMLPSMSAVVLGIWFTVLVGWAWLAVMSRHLYRLTPDPS